MMYSIGADPEVFIKNTETGKHVRAHGKIMGTKRHPYFVGEYNTKHSGDAIQVDGLAAEFNVTPVQMDKTGRTKFIRGVARVFKLLEREVHNGSDYIYNETGEKNGKHLVLEAVPTAEFEQAYMDSLTPQEKELGCDPDFNGWDGYPNRRPDANGCFRTGSGHVHIGFGQNCDVADNDHFERCMATACELDYYLGIPSLLWDGDARRRALYGKAGAFRPKAYGMEYRVLSNVWVTNPVLIGYIYDAVELCMTNMESGKKFVDITANAAVDVINNSDIHAAQNSGELLAMLGHKLPENF